MPEFPAKLPPLPSDKPGVEPRTLRDTFIILRERLWLALPLALLIAVGYASWQASQPPLYVARAAVEFEKPDAVVTTQGVVDQTMRSDFDPASYARALASDPMRDRVLASFTPEESKLLRRGMGARRTAAAAPDPRWLGEVEFPAHRNGLVIGLTVRHPDPQGAALVANRYIREFIAEVSGGGGGGPGEPVPRQREALDRLRRDSAAADQAFQNFRRDHATAPHAPGSEFDQLRAQAAARRSAYLGALGRLNEAIAAQSLQKDPIARIDAAAVPRSSLAPSPGAIFGASTFLFLLTYCGVALGLHAVDDRIKSAWDVESHLGSHLLGIVPDLSPLAPAQRPRLLLDGRDPPSAEALLGICSAVKINSRLDFPKTILVTSTLAGEGKSLVACNLAAAFARQGRRTLLVDGHLARPQLHALFSQQNHLGLVRWYERGADFTAGPGACPDLALVNLGANLALLRAGGLVANPGPLLESPLLGQLLEQLKREFDLIVIDGAPLAPAPARPALPRVDEVVYVCRFNRAPRRQIAAHLRALRAARVEVVGMVLNGLSPRRIQYYSHYRSYRSYKKYYGAQT